MLREVSQSVFGVGVGVYPWKATAQGEKACFAPSPDHQKRKRVLDFSATKSEFATCKIFLPVA
jgi:hypothetical protein